MEKNYSRYLLEEHPISFHPTLACAIGLNEAILLQKINLWLNCKPHNADGRAWIYNSYKSWQEQLPFWSIDTVKRALKSLSDKGIILKENFNKAKFDKTLWYSIDYEKLDKIVDQYKADNKQNLLTISANCTNAKEQIDTTYTNDYTKNTNISSSKDEEVREHFEKIWEYYPSKKGKAKALQYYLGFIKGRKINNITYKLTDIQMYYAVRRYAKECEENKTEIQFIKHGDTFFNTSILDYVEEK